MSLRFPSPPIRHGILGRLLGHFPEIRDVTVKHKKNFGMGIYMLKDEWYNSTKSKTIELNLMGQSVVACSDPNVYKEVLGAKQEFFTNSVPFKKTFGFFFPTSMIVVDGEQWQRIRRVAQKAIGKQSLDPVVPIMCESADMVLSHPKVNEVNTATMMNRITFDGFHRVMYGWDPKSIVESPDSLKILESCNVVARAMGKRSLAPIEFLWKLPTAENRQADAACAHIRDFVLQFASSRRAELLKKSEDQPKSLLDAMLIAAQSGEDGGMSDQELHDQIATLFFGAYDTTSGTLHFLLNYLARYPDEQESLRRHLRARFATRADLARAPLADVEAVAPLCHFVDEVNRLHAIAPFFARTALRDVEVAGRLVPAGANFLIDSATVGRDPALWDGQADLDRFRPARWAGRRAGPLASPMPFGFGGRICPGRKIAMAEMRAFVAAVLLSHRVALRDPAEPLSFDMLIGLNLTAGNGNIRFDPA